MLGQWPVCEHTDDGDGFWQDRTVLPSKSFSSG